jgi:hypothetical protein
MEGVSYVGTFIKITDASSVEIIAMSGFDFLIADIAVWSIWKCGHAIPPRRLLPAP